MKRKRRSYGEGRVFRRGAIWWIAWCQGGEETRESARSPVKADAQRLLEARLDPNAPMRPRTRAVTCLTIRDLLAFAEAEYRRLGRKSLKALRCHTSTLTDVFGDLPARDLTWTILEETGANWITDGSKATKRAGLGSWLIHDLRRSAVRNLVRSGVSETVAMTISGHQDRAVFCRYDVSSDGDKAAALTRVGAYLEKADATPNVQVIPVMKVAGRSMIRTENVRMLDVESPAPVTQPFDLPMIAPIPAAETGLSL